MANWTSIKVDATVQRKMAVAKQAWAKNRWLDPKLDAKTLTAVRQGLKEAAQGKTVYLGSFAKEATLTDRRRVRIRSLCAGRPTR